MAWKSWDAWRKEKPARAIVELSDQVDIFCFRQSLVCQGQKGGIVRV